MYTTCTRCNKPLLHPSHTDVHNKPTGGFSYCIRCMKSFTTCSIWYVKYNNSITLEQPLTLSRDSRLPVRALLFLCPVCQHGGHQSCYQRYYLNRPVVPVSIPHPLPIIQSDSPVAEPRLRRAASKTGDGDGSDDGASTRDGDEGSPALRFPESLTPDGKVGGLSGHPCAAGCGHVCWAMNIPVVHDSLLGSEL